MREEQRTETAPQKHRRKNGNSKKTLDFIQNISVEKTEGSNEKKNGKR